MAAPEAELSFLFKEPKAQGSYSGPYLNSGLEGTRCPLIINYRDSLRLPSMVGLLLSGNSTKSFALLNLSDWMRRAFTNHVVVLSIDPENSTQAVVRWGAGAWGFLTEFSIRRPTKGKCRSWWKPLSESESFLMLRNFIVYKSVHEYY